jgi:cell division protein FtsQ
MPQVKRQRRAAPGAQRRRAAPVRQRKPQPGWSTKLGAWAYARMRDVEYDPGLRRGLQVAGAVAVGAVAVTLAITTGFAADVGRSIAAAGASAARTTGLAVESLDVRATAGFALTDLQRAEAAEAAGVERDAVMFSLDPAAVRDRVMVLPWVESVTVRRLWPDRVQILIEPRPAVAVWQKGGTLAFIDARGRLLTPATMEQARGYALVVGTGAPEASATLFTALSTRKEVAVRTGAAIRVGSRRWTLRLRSGADVLLPETGIEAALDRLEALQASHRLLDRRFASLDLRAPGRLFIVPGTEVPAVTTGGV